MFDDTPNGVNLREVLREGIDFLLHQRKLLIVLLVQDLQGRDVLRLVSLSIGGRVRMSVEFRDADRRQRIRLGLTGHALVDHSI